MSMFSELRYILRTLRRAPGYTAAVVVTLALGIGANTAVFSVVDAVLLRQLPYDDPEQVFRIRERTRFSENTPMSPNQIEALQNGSQGWADIEYLDSLIFNLSTDGGAERINGAAVSPGFFGMLGSTPILGRNFTPASPTAEPAAEVILSHDLWQSRFGGREDIFGEDIEMNWSAPFGPRRELGDRFTVIGVLPPGFLPPYGAGELFVPASPPRETAPRDFNYLFPFARLTGRDDVEAQNTMSALVAALPPPAWRAGDEQLEVGVALRPVGQASVSRVQTALWILWSAVGLVLLAACANVANLMLNRNARRRRELDVRLALGASRGQLIRWLLAESLLLAFSAAALGMVLAWAGLKFLHALGPTFLPRLAWITVDQRLFTFAAVAAVITTVLFGGLPGWLASRSSGIASGGLRSASRAPTARRLSGGLVIAQVALSVVLLVNAALLVRSFQHLLAIDLGFETENLATFEVSLPPTHYAEAEQRSNFQQQVLDAVAALPGVESAAIGSGLPMTLINTGTPLILAGGGEDGASPPRVSFRKVTAGYLDTLGVPHLSGRPFDRRDMSPEPTSILINRHLAEQNWPDRSPIGETVGLPAPGIDQATIIGVVGDIRQSGPIRDVRPTVFIPSLGSQTFGVVLRLRDPGGVDRDELAAIVAAIDPTQPIHSFRTFDSPQDRWLGRPMFNAWAMSLFGALALTVSVFGLLAVLSSSVSQRTSEIGIRQALGAQVSDILQLISRQGLGLVMTGAICGLALSLASARLVTSLLHGINATDPWTLLAAASGAILIAMPAILLPARRASTIAPSVALRSGE